MPAKPAIKSKLQIGSYCQQKLTFLKDIEQFVREEKKAIDDLDLKRIEELVSKIEDLQSKIEVLDKSQELVSEQNTLADSERDLILNALEKISRIRDENLRRLLEKRDIVLLGLKTLQTKKNARKAYGNLQDGRSLLSKR